MVFMSRIVGWADRSRTSRWRLDFGVVERVSLAAAPVPLSTLCSQFQIAFLQNEDLNSNYNEPRASCDAQLNGNVRCFHSAARLRLQKRRTCVAGSS